MAADSAAVRAATDEVDTRTGRRVAIVVAVALVVVAYVMNAALPASPFTLPGPKAETVRSLLPQGWAFFTKSPRSRSAEVYQHEADGGWRNITAGPRHRAGDLMGLDRLGRSQGTELALLLALAPKGDWRECERAPTACLSQSTVTRTLPNRSTHHSICGEVGVVLQDVLPWAWRDAPTTMPSKVLRVRVTC
ncbi:SdpA family antimicrobial peptide system protein [Plantactinospora sp. B6F1]|uniref:SdpA family antimicrobial peptide system protein n=1 Tax=Plantactinospora sp. B6F1 TaxID=3158971 RepID=UPI00102B6CA0